MSSLCDTCEKAETSCPVYPLNTQQCVEFVEKQATLVSDVVQMLDMLEKRLKLVEKTNVWQDRESEVYVTKDDYMKLVSRISDLEMQLNTEDGMASK